MTVPNTVTFQRVIREQEGRAKSALSAKRVNPSGLNALNALNARYPASEKMEATRAAREGERVCAQCHAGPSTEPPGDPPTLRIEEGAEEIWLHPECLRFWKKNSGNHVDQFKTRFDLKFV